MIKSVEKMSSPDATETHQLTEQNSAGSGSFLAQMPSQAPKIRTSGALGGHGGSFLLLTAASGRDGANQTNQSGQTSAVPDQCQTMTGQPALPPAASCQSQWQ